MRRQNRHRRRHSRPIKMLGAFLVEAAAMLTIVALAQPTWTRNLIEQISPASQMTANATSVESAGEAAAAFGSKQAVLREPAMPSQGSTGWQQVATSSTQTSEPSHVMQPARDTTDRLAMSGWSAPSMPANEYFAASPSSQYSVDPYASHQYYSNGPQLNPRSAIRPIYPPPASSQAMPAWSNSY